MELCQGGDSFLPAGLLTWVFQSAQAMALAYNSKGLLFSSLVELCLTEYQDL